ncbi:MAG TPA: HNH endonuclease [Chryseolinea sp.]|nr:HNH endonuclease [Chryseolinea sp.]
MGNTNVNIEFFPLVGFNTYVISRCGVVKRLSRKTSPKSQLRKDKKKMIAGRQLVPQLRNGYVRIDLRRNGKCTDGALHRLLAINFIPNPENKPCVNHINGNKQDNRLENLEWVTHKENNVHAVDIGLIPSGSRHRCAKLSESDVINVRQLFTGGFSKYAIAKKYNLSPGTIYNIISGRTWKRFKPAA